MPKSCTIEIDKAERETDALKIDVIIIQVASDWKDFRNYNNVEIYSKGFKKIDAF